jgi:transposase
MGREIPVKITYSIAFRRKVVNEIERGKYSIEGARKLYDIGGSMTIQRWMKKFGKGELISKVIKIQTKNELDKVKELEREKKELESALAQSQVKIYALEALVEIAKEDYGIDLKKKPGSKELLKHTRKQRKTHLK